jgi:ABC-type nitrate/sulfonate/bicarbonate transport system permease component
MRSQTAASQRERASDGDRTGRGRSAPQVSNLTGLLWPALLIAAVLTVWEIVVRVRHVPRWLLPPPSQIGRTLVDDRTLLLTNARVTLSEILLGFGLAVVVGVTLGVLIANVGPVARAVYPIVITSQTIPVPAIAPLLLIWFGYGLFPKVLVTALIGFFPIVVNTVDGIRSTDRDTLDLFRTLRANAWDRLRHAQLPSALPAIFSGARIAMTACVIGAVFAELTGSSAGLGYLLNRSAPQFLTARVFAIIVVLSLLGIGLFALLALIERLALPWRRVR